MMKLLFTFFLFTAIISNLFAVDINQVRKDYIKAVEDSDVADKLCQQLEEIKNPDALMLAYLGSVQAIKAKHAWNPVNKMSFLKQGFDTINSAVNKDPNQLEVRFLRFSLQYYVPAFLGYSKNLMNDKSKIVSILRTTDPTALKMDNSILKNMVNFMIDSKKCSEQDIAILKKSIS